MRGYYHSNPERVIEDDGEYQSSRQVVERSGTPVFSLEFGVWSLESLNPEGVVRPQAGGGAQRNPCFQFGVWSVEFGVAEPRRGGKTTGRRWSEAEPLFSVWSLEFGVAEPRRGGKTTGRRWSEAEPLLIVATQT